MIRTIGVLAAAIAILVPGGSLAAQTPTPTAKTPVDDWYVGLDENGVCSLANRYEGAGSTDVAMYGAAPSDPIIMFISNMNWSIAQDQKMRLEITLDKKRFPIDAVGEVSAGRKAFVFPVNEEFFDAFRLARQMRITHGETLVDALTLQGSADGAARFAHCIVKARPITQRDSSGKAFGNVPIDPFSQSATP